MSKVTSALWQTTGVEADLPRLAREIAGHLKSADPFCLWLKGPLGAGKTTLSGAILRELGLGPNVRVTSPTFTYVNEYQANDRWYAHLDLYRGSVHLTPEDLGLVDSRTFRGYLVEWPESIPASPVLAPTHILAIAFSADGLSRSYELTAPKS